MNNDIISPRSCDKILGLNTYVRDSAVCVNENFNIIFVIL